MDDVQKRTAQAIVNIFETGRALGDYGQVTLLANDTGQLTYGRSQTTLASGNLALLVKAYCDLPGAQFGAAMRPYLGALERCDIALNHDTPFRALLRQAGDDPAMHDCQDAFFDRVYWTPAARAAAELGIESALGVTVVYDSTVHGSWRLMRDRTIANRAPAADTDEHGWIAAYIAIRRDWLATHSNALLHRTVYRMDALQRLVDQDKWDLPLPLTVRGVVITADLLAATVPVRASAQVVDERVLRLRMPYMAGEDVKAVQSALARAGATVEPDGIYGPATADAVASYQAARGLVSDGIVGPSTRAALGCDGLCPLPRPFPIPPPWEPGSTCSAGLCPWCTRSPFALSGPEGAVSKGERGRAFAVHASIRGLAALGRTQHERHGWLEAVAQASAG